MKLLIKNGDVIDPSCDREGEFDLLIENGKIAAVESRGQLEDATVDETVDASGFWISPGLVDIHVHFRDPGQHWKETIESGSAAAALGGFTSVCCMPNTVPANDSAEITRYMIEKGKLAGLTRILPIGAVSIGLEGKQMAPLSELRRAGCVAFSDDGQPIYDAGLMRRALEWCKELDVVISCHEEDKCLSASGSMNESARSLQMGLRGFPNIAEDVMVARDIEIARCTGARTHFCHVSTARSTELIRRAKNDGIPVSAETTPHHISLTEEAVEGFNTAAKMSPPLRVEEDRIGVLEGLKDGTLDALASDHAPHELEAKQIEFERAAFGIIGLQTNLPILLEAIRDGHLSRRDAFRRFSTGPAQVFGLEAGSLARGKSADLVLIDPSTKWKFEKESIVSKSKNSPFLGREFIGRADSVFLGGKRVVKRGELVESE